uniref:DUF4806 domain-containing protein n=1 Tax=Meloidogyne incognita TaxID=6306 RepID=A0A914NX87_MELIC
MEEEVGTDDDMHTADEEGKTPIKKVARQLNERELQQKLATLEKEIAKLGINRMREGLPLPEFYSGIEDFEAYLRRFNKIATAHQWSGTRCTQILPLYLLEEARAIYDSLGADSKNTWKGLTDALAIKLKKLNTKESARRSYPQKLLLGLRKKNLMI